MIRRTNQFWTGLSCDLVVEQTLMRSLKSTGVLTRGGKMTKEQGTLWTMSVPITSEINVAMQDFNDLTYATSEHHKEAAGARIERDASDLSKINTKLNAFSSFSSDPTLRNIINGIAANEDINVHI